MNGCQELTIVSEMASIAPVLKFLEKNNNKSHTF